MITEKKQTLIIGCGNLLRGDDSVGPIMIRRLWEIGLPDGIFCSDGGTAGMDVAFQMRGKDKVIIIDACKTGEAAGTVFKVPGEELENLPPLTDIHTHNFRWDNALAFGRWLLKDEYPQDITVYLIEGENFEFGEVLSPKIKETMEKLAIKLLDELSLEVEKNVAVSA